jgi:hypothetical protein
MRRAKVECADGSGFVALSFACVRYTSGSRVENICSSLLDPKALKDRKRQSHCVGAELSKPPHAVLFINGKAGIGHRLLREELCEHLPLAVCSWNPKTKASASIETFIDSLARPQTTLQKAAQVVGAAAHLRHSVVLGNSSSSSTAGIRYFHCR